MKLDDITANIRLRSPWEAVDLGFALVQHNARWIFPAWSVVLLSVALLAWVLTPPITTILPRWWCGGSSRCMTGYYYTFSAIRCSTST